MRLITRQLSLRNDSKKTTPGAAQYFSGRFRFLRFFAVSLWGAWSWDSIPGFIAMHS